MWRCAFAASDQLGQKESDEWMTGTLHLVGSPCVIPFANEQTTGVNTRSQGLTMRQLLLILAVAMSGCGNGSDTELRQEMLAEIDSLLERVAALEKEADSVAEPGEESITPRTHPEEIVAHRFIAVDDNGMRRAELDGQRASVVLVSRPTTDGPLNRIYIKAQPDGARIQLIKGTETQIELSMTIDERYIKINRRGNRVQLSQSDRDRVAQILVRDESTLPRIVSAYKYSIGVTVGLADQDKKLIVIGAAMDRTD
jgi:hypothetical protein